VTNITLKRDFEDCGVGAKSSAHVFDTHNTRLYVRAYGSTKGKQTTTPEILL